MPFLYGLILLLALIIPISYGLKYLMDYLIVQSPNDGSEDKYSLKHPLASVNNSRATVLIVGTILSLTFTYFVINYKTYTLDFEEPELKKDTIYVDPLAQIEITEQKPRPKPQKKIAIEVKEVEKVPDIDSTILFDPEEEEEEFDDFDIPTEGVVEAEPVNEEPVLRADVMPRYEGGDVDFQRDPNFLKYVSQNFNKNKIREGETGTIYVSFVIEKDGSISNVTILRGMNERLDNEVKRVIGLIPGFSSPAMTNGVPVRLKFNWPFKIK